MLEVERRNANIQRRMRGFKAGIINYHQKQGEISVECLFLLLTV